MAWYSKRSSGSLRDETQIVYVSPLKALSNDIQRNLEAPLAGIKDALHRLGLPDADLRTFVRTGDTPQVDRNRMRKKPPHIVVTTPESLYILLGSESGRGMLKTTRTVIVDEIHALASNKRGSHLALSLERLEALAGKPLLRIGLSATQKPIEIGCAFPDRNWRQSRASFLHDHKHRPQPGAGPCARSAFVPARGHHVG